MSDIADRRFDAEQERANENRDPDDERADMMEDLEHDIEESIGNYPNLTDDDVISVLQGYIDFLKKRKQDKINFINNQN